MKNTLKKTLAADALAVGIVATTAGVANAVAVPPGGGGNTQTLGYYSSDSACMNAANAAAAQGVANLHCWLSYNTDGSELWTLTGQ
jgi:hypothetical protein